MEEITAKDNADDGWIEAEDEHGNKYYTNYLTGESAWSLPTAHLEEVKGLFDDVIDQGEDRDETIETVYKRFRTGEGKDGLIDYAEFCKVLQVGTRCLCWYDNIASESQLIARCLSAARWMPMIKCESSLIFLMKIARAN